MVGPRRPSGRARVDAGRRRRRGEGTREKRTRGKSHSGGESGGTRPHEDPEGGAAVLHVPQSQSKRLAGLEASCLNEDEELDQSSSRRHVARETGQKEVLIMVR